MDTRGWSDVAYNFCIDDDGVIYEGRGFFAAGGHTKGDNTKSHAICFMGNFENREPTQAALVAAAELARYGREIGAWGEITGSHRDAQAWGYSPKNGTLCAGKHVQNKLGAIRWLSHQNEEANRMDKATADQIVEDTYRLILGREADQAGRDSWSKELQEGRMDAVGLSVTLLRVEGMPEVHRRLTELESKVK